jgi:hypothetical protein
MTGLNIFEIIYFLLLRPSMWTNATSLDTPRGL